MTVARYTQPCKVQMYVMPVVHTRFFFIFAGAKSRFNTFSSTGSALAVHRQHEPFLPLHHQTRLFHQLTDSVAPNLEAFPAQLLHQPAATQAKLCRDSLNGAFIGGVMVISGVQGDRKDGVSC